MCRGGTIRSSDEVPVMGMERRDCIIQFWTAVNLGNKGGTKGQNKALGGWIMGAGWCESLKSGSERAWGEIPLGYLPIPCPLEAVRQLQPVIKEFLLLDIKVLNALFLLSFYPQIEL